MLDAQRVQGPPVAGALQTLMMGALQTFGEWMMDGDCCRKRGVREAEESDSDVMRGDPRAFKPRLACCPLDSHTYEDKGRSVTGGPWQQGGFLGVQTAWSRWARTLEGPSHGSVLCCCHVEMLHFRTSDLEFLLCTGSYKFFGWSCPEDQRKPVSTARRYTRENSVFCWPVRKWTQATQGSGEKAAGGRWDQSL